MTSPTAARNAARLQRRTAALAAREHMSPRGPASERFRVATWNVNSLKVRAPALDRFLERARPDVICLQETKAARLVADASALLDRHGYQVVYAGDGPYNGVAIASRHPITSVTSSGGFDRDHVDREARLVTCVVDPGERIRIASVYVPHGREVGHWHYDYKLDFLAELTALVRAWLSDGSLIVAGDINVAPTDSDIFHPDAFVGLTHVTGPERDAWRAVLDAGLVDIDAAVWGPDQRRFTWWNHGISYGTNLGMRLDVIATDPALAARVDTTWIDHIERGAQRPSDHAALVADFRLRAPWATTSTHAG